MNAVELIALILFAAGGAIPFIRNIDVRVAFVCIAIAGALVCLELGEVIT